MTRSENLKHAYQTGLKKPQGLGVGINKSKPVMAVNIDTGEVIHASSAKELATKLDIPSRTVQAHAFDRTVPKPIRGYLITKGA